jgi:hypothetical protein
MKNINSVKIKLAILASLFLFFGNTYADETESDIQVFSSGWAPTGIYRGQERWGVLSIKTSSSREFFATDKDENPYFSHSIRGSFIEKASVGCISKASCTVMNLNTLASVGCISEASYTVMNLNTLVHDTALMHPTLAKDRIHFLVSRLIATMLVN